MLRKTFFMLLITALILGVLPTVQSQDKPLPAPRGYHRLTYDMESERFILFGGISFRTPANSGLDFLNDTWAYDIVLNHWTAMNPAQSPSKPGPLAYDTESDRVILFLGGEWPSQSLRETWAYDFNTDTWTNMEPETAPPALLGGNMVYDSESDRMILFSGLDVFNSTPPRNWIFPADTWAYDFNSNTWTNMEPEVSPPGRSYHAMAYDVQADRVILFGGGIEADNPDGFETANDTWAYDYNSDTWTALEPSTAPLPRDYTNIVYSERLQQVILFGGLYEFGGGATALGDTWAYDFASNIWSELLPPTAPSARGWHALAYSPAVDQMILFGGGADRDHYNAEVWIFDPAANMWTEVGP